jgi:hypothetical protein
MVLLGGTALGQSAPPHHKYFVRVQFTPEGMKDLQNRSTRGVTNAPAASFRIQTSNTQT